MRFIYFSTTKVKPLVYDALMCITKCSIRLNVLNYLFLLCDNHLKSAKRRTANRSRRCVENFDFEQYSRLVVITPRQVTPV